MSDQSNIVELTNDEFRQLFDFGKEMKLGSGGYGKVVAAPTRRDIAIGYKKVSSGTVVTLKELPMRTEKEQRYVAQEVQILSLIFEQGCQPNIICPIATISIRDKHAFYLVYTFADGLPLNKFAKNNFEQNCYRSKLTNAQISAICLHLFRAVKTCHKYGIVHQDIKPSNVVVTFDKENHTLMPILIDFGLACPDDKNCWKNFGGTPGYMPPNKVILSEMSFDIAKKDDIFSTCATILYLLFTQTFYLDVESFLKKNIFKSAQKKDDVTMNENTTGEEFTLSGTFEKRLDGLYEKWDLIFSENKANYDPALLQILASGLQRHPKGRPNAKELYKAIKRRVKFLSKTQNKINKVFHIL